LQREHFINPVLYIEYEQISEADKIIKEVEGHDIEADHAVPNAEARQGHKSQLELKLLSPRTSVECRREPFGHETFAPERTLGIWHAQV